MWPIKVYSAPRHRSDQTAHAHNCQQLRFALRDLELGGGLFRKVNEPMKERFQSGTATNLFNNTMCMSEIHVVLNRLDLSCNYCQVGCVALKK